MAAKKRNIRNFKQALLSNTSFIKDEYQSAYGADAQLPDNAITLDKQTFAKFKILAQHQGIDHKELINEALSHYLRLKKLQIDEALENLQVGDDEG